VLALVLATMATTALPSEKDLGFALAVTRLCIDTDGFTNCGPQPTGATFERYLCAEYGADQENRTIVRCVYKGARMTMPKLRGRNPINLIGDGAIDLVYDGDAWVPAR
jgi:hypothetical protein